MLAEVYQNSVYWPEPTHMVQRWWVTPDIMVGGSICDAADFQHLVSKFNIQSVLNVETEHGDEGKGIARLCEARVPDDGTPFSAGIVRHAVSFAKLNNGLGPIYVHCQMGDSRSPAFAYAILRWVYGMSPEAALQAIQDGKDWSLKNQNGQLVGGSGMMYGDHPSHRSYLRSIEDALRV